jgi:beta-glucanase (GH16 family)
VAVAHSSSAALSWKRPASTGGGAITGYIVTPHRGSITGAPRRFPRSATRGRIHGLLDGVGYQFTVVATNASGPSHESEWSNYVVPSTVPGTPSQAASAPGANDATVMWISPHATLYPIKYYLVRPYAQGKALPAIKSRPTVNAATVRGLRDGTSYRFTVTAVNAIGRGRRSNLTNPSVPAPDRVTFTDDFTSRFGANPNAGLARPIWSLEGCWSSGCGNNSDAQYLARNSYQDGKGNLVLRATSKATSANCGSRRCNYTGAGLHMYKSSGPVSWAQKYGTFSARIKTPVGPGLWPAFWLVGSNSNQVGWPACGEIDAMEADGDNTSLVQQHIHYGINTNNQMGGASSLPPGQSTAAWHTYSVTWSPSGIVWRVDGTLTRAVLASTVGAANWHKFFDHPFGVILDLTVDGTYVRPPTAATHFPAKMLVGYVQVTKL